MRAPSQTTWHGSAEEFVLLMRHLRRHCCERVLPWNDARRCQSVGGARDCLVRTVMEDQRTMDQLLYWRTVAALDHTRTAA